MGSVTLEPAFTADIPRERPILGIWAAEPLWDPCHRGVLLGERGVLRLGKDLGKGGEELTLDCPSWQVEELFYGLHVGFLC